MEKEEFNSFIQKLTGEIRKNQFEFYNNCNIFLNSNKQFLINRGGMGLGKTLAVSKSISENELLEEVKKRDDKRNS